MIKDARDPAVRGHHHHRVRPGWPWPWTMTSRPLIVMVVAPYFWEWSHGQASLLTWSESNLQPLTLNLIRDVCSPPCEPAGRTRFSVPVSADENLIRQPGQSSHVAHSGAHRS